MIGPSLPPRSGMTCSAPTPGQRRKNAVKNVVSSYLGCACCVCQTAPDFRSCAYFVLNSLYCDCDFSRPQN